MKLVIGSDQKGYPLKVEILKYLRECGIQCADFGVNASDLQVDYPDIAQRVAESIACGEFERGILICGLGIGMSIAANKVPGIRAALCHDVYSAQKSRTSNDAQILTMGAEVIKSGKAKKVVNAWLNADFAGGSSARKIRKIQQIEEKYNNQSNYTLSIAS
jgi:ribose 5-phosphate isomerase B